MPAIAKAMTIQTSRSFLQGVLSMSRNIHSRFQPGRFAIAALAMLAAILGNGCTVLPTKEFSSYKEAFAQARQAGESVLIDYSTATRQYEDLVNSRNATQPKGRVRASEIEFKVESASSSRIDHIAVRMAAWDVVARYNDLLTKLAEGKAAGELTSAVDGLTESLSTFPVERIAAAAADVSGFLAPLKPLLAEAAMEQQRRKFIEAVLKGQGLIQEKFLGLLREDIGDFYRVRKTLNDNAYRAHLAKVAGLATEFETTIENWQGVPGVTDPLLVINDAIGSLPLDAKGNAKIAQVEFTSGGITPPPEQLAKLALLADHANESVAKALEIDAELLAYRDVLSAYASLIDEVSLSLRALKVAAEQARPSIPRGEELRRRVILLREALDSYKD